MKTFANDIITILWMLSSDGFQVSYVPHHFFSYNFTEVIYR